MNLLQRLKKGNILYPRYKVCYKIYFWENHSKDLYIILNSYTKLKRTRIVYQFKEIGLK